MAVNISRVIRILNIVLGVATISLGIYVLFSMLHWFQVKQIKFVFSDIPQYMMPFFFALFGTIVLSAEFNLVSVRRHCQFIVNKFGVFVFYLYLATLMGYFAEVAKAKGDEFNQFICMCCGLGYIVLAVMMALLSIFGEDKTNEKIDEITEKITRDE